jgi:hypothetical protein
MLKWSVICYLLIGCFDVFAFTEAQYAHCSYGMSFLGVGNSDISLCETFVFSDSSYTLKLLKFRDSTFVETVVESVGEYEIIGDSIVLNELECFFENQSSICPDTPSKWSFESSLDTFWFDGRRFDKVLHQIPQNIHNPIRNQVVNTVSWVALFSFLIYGTILLNNN